MESPAAGHDVRVSFLLGGAQKAGTTSLDAWLREHPQVAMPHSRKELHFFDLDGNFAAATPTYADYHACFDAGASGIHGESTPAYMYFPAVPARVAAYNPEMKWILLLRDPADRAFSHWNMMREAGAEPLDFMSALDAEPDRIADRADLERRRRYSYLDRGRYAEQIRRLWHHFDRSRTLVLRSEHLWQDPTAGLQRICRFLGVPWPDTPTALQSAERGRYDAPISPQARERIQRELESANRELEQLLEIDLSDWRR
ncbi:MAG: sulfotransferase [Planctomycetota bacterium]